jgi:hypothetical protein
MVSAIWRWLLKFSSGQNEMFGLIRDLSLLPRENWENLEYKDYREFQNLSNAG